MKILISNIKELVQTEQKPKLKVSGKAMSKVDSISQAFLYIENGKIADFGKMADIRASKKVQAAGDTFEIDATGKMVFPSFCDSHTHLVYPSSREIEYIDKIKGLSYEEIARRGGGILNSARKMQEISEDELFDDAMDRLNEIIEYGTGAVEIKSGYGLTTESELKMLRVIKKLKEHSPLTIVSTFLGAHAIPPEYKSNQEEYVDMVINEMIPQVASEELADYIDVFCDRGFLLSKILTGY